MITPVILSGGTGSRLWPLSRSFYPKQLLNLVDEDLTLLQQTVTRCDCADLFSAALVICIQEHRFLVGEQLKEVNAESATIILEPSPRNTAPAIALAALHLAKEDPSALMLVMPADHLINDHDAFLAAAKVARGPAERGGIVTFGIVASKPETAYGYIESDVDASTGIGQVLSFTEKPNRELAEEYLLNSNYYWNGGLFMMSAETYIEELSTHAPDILRAAQKAMASPVQDLDFIRIDDQAFSESPSDSIDYAVMEKTSRAVMVPLDAGWSDVGSWSSLWEVLDKDADGNATQGNVVLNETKNSTVFSQSRLVATLGVEDLVVVETPDAVLVSHQAQSQKVKQIVEYLDNNELTQSEHHRKVYRPWGWYDSIDAGEGFQVKRIQVKPGAKLSKQRHQHRAEHWVVINGVAHVINGQDTITLNKNQSTYIPIGAVHSLHNPSASEILEIIEVQTGSYLGEDDIERFDDIYGRAD